MRFPRPFPQLAALAAALGALALAGAAPAQIVNPAPTDPKVRPAVRTLDCTSSGCHAEQKDHKVLHGPAAVGACTACHEYADAAKHTFAFKRAGRELCEFCHIDKSGREGPVVHAPVRTGDCTGCHDPHGARSRTLLKAESTVQLCTSCHKETMNGRHKHGPAAADCTACHRAHTSDHPKLLVAEPKGLCATCHQDVGARARSAAHPHPPARDDCLRCHSPHATDTPAVLTMPVQRLCASCHQKTVDSAAHAKVTHGALTDDRACLNCHVPHGSEFARQMSEDPVAACLKCHDKPIEVSAERTVAGVPEIGDKALHKHGAIEKGDCSGCHAVHGADHTRLLVANYNNSFYQKYDDKAYELCFRCHSKELIEDQADPQTRFRDGGRNLHALHVKSPRNGRNCRSCHAIHASRHSQLVNETVPFGAWKLPINFKPAAGGGSCSPGCHEPQTYDRSRPPGPAPTSPAPAPTPTPAPAPSAGAPPPAAGPAPPRPPGGVSAAERRP